MSAFQIRVEGVAGAKPQLPPDGAGKNHLPFTGNAGLHGKNILPCEGSRSQVVPYSDRSAAIGSTRVARRAGSHAAASVIASTAAALAT